MFKERRTFNRISTQLPTTVWPESPEYVALYSHITYTARIANVSAKGMYIYAPKRFKVGQRLHVQSTMPSRTTNLHVVVRRMLVEQGDESLLFGHGVEIQAGDQADIIALISYLHGLRRKKIIGIRVAAA